MTSSIFGESIPRREDPRLLRGQGCYVDDLGEDALAAAFVRSPHAHAAIREIDVRAALAANGVEAVYTHADLPEGPNRPLPMIIPHPAVTNPRTAHALANSVVRHVGEPVVMVVARDRYVAEDAADLVRIEYEPRPPVVGIEASLRAEALVHEDVDDNCAGRLVQAVGDAESAVAGAPHRLEFRLANERSASTPLECRAVYARWSRPERKLQVYSATQMPASLRVALAAILGLPLDDVSVTAPDVGGGFGVKGIHPYPEEVLVAWAAIALNRPVKWTEDRREHFTSSNHDRREVFDVKVGFDDDGRIQGLDVQFLHDVGAYCQYGITLPLITAAQLPGPYRLRNYRVAFKSLFTTTVSVTPYRGAGRPQAAFCMERTIDRIAAHLGRDRTEVRLANFVRADEMPYDVGLLFQDGKPTIYDSGDFAATLERLKSLIDWDGFPALKAAAEADGRQLGIGVGCYVEGTGVGPYEGAHVEVQTTGRVVVSTAVASQGQGHETVFAQIAAAELGVPVDSVHVVEGDTRRYSTGIGTFASRAAVMSGNAVAVAARAVRMKALTVAADALEAHPQDLEIVDAVVRVKGSPDRGIPLKVVAVLSNPMRYAFTEEARLATQFAMSSSAESPLPQGETPGLGAEGFFSPPRSTFANGAHAAIVEVDPVTSAVNILRYAVVHDCGRLINPMIVEGQIHGGVAQGIGGALYEKMAYDESGQLVNASFMDFLMPYATEIPPIEVAHLETPSPLNPLGVKGVGEAGVIPVAAVIAGAIEDALGIALSEMPLSPSELWHLRRSHASAP